MSVRPVPSQSRQVSAGLLGLTSGGRTIDELECVLSVLLAIAFAHIVGARNISWAAFSGYMVMRGHVADSLLRGVLRIFGTLVGAGLGLLLTPLMLPNIIATSLGAALVGGASLYGALTGRRAYAWLFVGLTFEMILLDKLANPGDALAAFARTRVLEVVAGTTACILISALSTLTVRRWVPGERMVVDGVAGWQAHAARHAAQGALALALVPMLHLVWADPDLSQSAVTIMAVMLLPVKGIGASGFVPVTRRLLNRVAGCLAGSALAAAVLFTAHGNAVALLAGTSVGVAIGRHIENGRTSVAYAGTQFTLAILVTLVPDSYVNAALDPAVERLLGILAGMALLEPVLVAWHLIVPARGSDRES
jgi:uncharacterized membrane protein YccC